MKKILSCLVILFVFSPFVLASSHHSHNSHNHSHHNNCHHSSGGNSTPVYLVNKEVKQEEVKFQDCNEHYAIQVTTTDLFSDGSKRIYTNNTVYNTDGSVLISDCSSVKHIIYENKHYFIVYKQKGYQILDNNAKAITVRKYSKMQELSSNRFLVKYNKHYGIIDLHEQTIVPVKYKKLERISYDRFITKLNGYHGIIDINNNIILDNDCDKIKPILDTYVVKRYDKYGLYDINANKILDIENDKISKLGDYILVKKNNRYMIYDYSGKSVNENKYKKVRLKRNHLYGTRSEREEQIN